MKLLRLALAFAFSVATSGCNDAAPRSDHGRVTSEEPSELMYPGDHDPLLDGYLSYVPDASSADAPDSGAQMCTYAASGGDIAIVEILTDGVQMPGWALCDPGYSGVPTTWRVRVLGHVFGNALPKELDVIVVNPPLPTFPERGQRGLAALREDADERFLIGWGRLDVSREPTGLTPARGVESDLPATFAELVGEMAAIKADYQNACVSLPPLDERLPWPSSFSVTDRANGSYMLAVPPGQPTTS